MEAQYAKLQASYAVNSAIAGGTEGKIEGLKGEIDNLKGEVSTLQAAPPEIDSSGSKTVDKNKEKIDAKLAAITQKSAQLAQLYETAGKAKAIAERDKGEMSTLQLQIKETKPEEAEKAKENETAAAKQKLADDRENGHHEREVRLAKATVEFRKYYNDKDPSTIKYLNEYINAQNEAMKPY